MSKSRSLGAAVAFAVLSTAGLATAPANAAVVYSKTAGVPQGCVVGPTAVATVARAAVVTPGAPVARAAVVAPGARVAHAGATRLTPHGERHVGYTRVRR